MEIEFKDVTFGYMGGSRNVLENINLKIEGPGLVCIIGPNGVGKSTLADKLHELNPNSFIFDAEEVFRC